MNEWRRELIREIAGVVLTLAGIAVVWHGLESYAVATLATI